MHPRMIFHENPYAVGQIFYERKCAAEKRLFKQMMMCATNHSSESVSFN